MEISLTEKKLSQESLVNALIKELKQNELDFNLKNAFLFNEFPIYKDLDEEIVIAQILIISEKHGIILFQVDNSTSMKELISKKEKIEDNLDNLFSILFTRLLRNKLLRKNKRELLFPINTIVYTPLITDLIDINNSDLFYSTTSILVSTLNKCQTQEDLPLPLYYEIKSTIEGSKALIKTKIRENVKQNSKGDIVNHLEKEIASFDQYQRSAYTSFITGVSRVRGLAGSGKTIVLAIKAALTHLKYPNAKIAYTFYTKSLHQHVKRLITRFYRQFEDRDPDWDNLEILHAWGSSYTNGIYYNACKANDIYPLSFSYAAEHASKSTAFEYVCNDFLSKAKKDNFVYDYIFIDEGQDFPQPF